MKTNILFLAVIFSEVPYIFEKWWCITLGYIFMTVGRQIIENKSIPIVKENETPIFMNIGKENIVLG